VEKAQNEHVDHVCVDHEMARLSPVGDAPSHPFRFRVSGLTKWWMWLQHLHRSLEEEAANSDDFYLTLGRFVLFVD
jgi:hypothetical protein